MPFTITLVSPSDIVTLVVIGLFKFPFVQSVTVIRNMTRAWYSLPPHGLITTRTSWNCGASLSGFIFHVADEKRNLRWNVLKTMCQLRVLNRTPNHLVSSSRLPWLNTQSSYEQTNALQKRNRARKEEKTICEIHFHNLSLPPRAGKTKFA